MKALSLIATATLLLFATRASAQDLSSALDYIDENFGDEGVEGYEEQRDPERHEALAMLTARDVTVGKPLGEYDCWETPVDGESVVRTSGEQHWATRACHEYKFRKKNVAGYREVGQEMLTEQEVLEMSRPYSRRHNIPEIMIPTIARFASGYRPRTISEKGHKGLLQLREDNLEAVGITDYGDLLDPHENLRVGTLYFARLTVRTGGYMGTLTAWHEGLVNLVKHGWNGSDPHTLWFVREVDRFFFAVRANRFPTDVAAESMTFVWSWMD